MIVGSCSGPLLLTGGLLVRVQPEEPALKLHRINSFATAMRRPPSKVVDSQNVVGIGSRTGRFPQLRARHATREPRVSGPLVATARERSFEHAILASTSGTLRRLHKYRPVTYAAPGRSAAASPRPCPPRVGVRPRSALQQAGILSWRSFDEAALSWPIQHAPQFAHRLIDRPIELDEHRRATVDGEVARG